MRRGDYGGFRRRGGTQEDRGTDLHLLWILFINLHCCSIAGKKLPFIHGPHSHNYLHQGTLQHHSNLDM